MTTHPVEVGEAVYLVPRTPGAPSAAYRQPRGVITTITEATATVRLDASGEQITTNKRNVVRHLPRRARSPKGQPTGTEEAAAVRQPTGELPPPTPRELTDGVEEIPLF
jgi:hypothetical protein